MNDMLACYVSFDDCRHLLADGYIGKVTSSAMIALKDALFEQLDMLGMSSKPEVWVYSDLR
jgi:hypothetical protein